MTMCVHGFWAGGDDEAVHQSPIAAREVPGLDDLDVQRPLPHCLRLRFRALQVMVNVLPFLRCSGLDVDWGQRSASVRRRERAIRLGRIFHSMSPTHRRHPPKLNCNPCSRLRAVIKCKSKKLQED
eukprot:778239-Rhodomonas_salina.1